MITQDSIEKLKDHLDIVDTVSNYIQLKKYGANYKGLCPFHAEKTPSFTVSPAKQIFHCFGCGKGGDSVKFVMEIEGLKYPEALEKLAKDNGISLEYDKQFIKQDTSILVGIQKFYKKNLITNQVALKYLRDRGVFESSIEEFEIGFAPDSNSTLNFLNSQHYNLSQALEVGVLAEGKSLYARFIDRIIFPIFSQSGEVVGFGGRTISNHPAKYINSPQSKVFNKSKLLYGYHRAKSSILKNSKIIITEGYLDVVMLHQAGWTNSVATLGTALTEQHIPIISKTNSYVILAYDGDSAGRVAALKASYILNSKGIEGGVVLFGDGKDPADMVKENKINELNLILNNPKPLVKFIIEEIIAKFDIANPHQKQKALDEAVAFLKTLKMIIALEYKEYLSSLLGIDSKMIKLNNTNQTSSPQQQDQFEIAEASLIKTAYNNDFYINILINMLEPFYFKYHYNEYISLISFENNNSKLLEIVLNDNIKVLDEDDFSFQINILLVRDLEEQMLKIKNNPTLTLSQKSKKIRELREEIKQKKLKET